MEPSTIILVLAGCTAAAVAAFLLGRRLGRLSAEQAAEGSLAPLRESQAVLNERISTQTARAAETTERLEEETRRTRALEARLSDLSAEHAAYVAEAEAELRARTEALETARAQMADSFKSASAEAITQAMARLTEKAKDLMAEQLTGAKGEMAQRHEAIASLHKQMGETLGKVQQQVTVSDKERAAATAAIEAHVKALTESNQVVAREARSLTSALKQPQVRGQWGEVALRRVLELSGLPQGVGYTEQHTVETDEGSLRPDVIVHLPGGRSVVIDSKASIGAMLDAQEARSDADRAAALGDLARHVKTHVTQLSSKRYQDALADTPEFVVLFLPTEGIFSAALQADPALLELAWRKNVIIASPSTVLALLRTIAQGWQHERMAENAREVQRLGAELYERLGKVADHLATLGKRLKSTVGAYNETVGSFDRRLLSSARKFPALGVTAEQTLATPELLDEQPARVTSVEETRSLLAAEDEADPSPQRSLDEAVALVTPLKTRR